MAVPDGSTPATRAVDEFVRHLGARFSPTTCRIRQRYLEEYLAHARAAAGPGVSATQLTVRELMEPERADAWLADAAAGKLRTRNTRYGPEAAATANSMRVRTDSWNAFAQFLAGPAAAATARARLPPDPIRHRGPAARPVGAAAHRVQLCDVGPDRGHGRAGGRHRPGRPPTGRPQGHRAAPGRPTPRRPGRR